MHASYPYCGGPHSKDSKGATPMSARTRMQDGGRGRGRKRETRPRVTRLQPRLTCSQPAAHVQSTRARAAKSHLVDTRADRFRCDRRARRSFLTQLGAFECPDSHLSDDTRHICAKLFSAPQQHHQSSADGSAHSDRSRWSFYTRRASLECPFTGLSNDSRHAYNRLRDPAHSRLPCSSSFNLQLRYVPLLLCLYRYLIKALLDIL
jgi:hypothetical protein